MAHLVTKIAEYGVIINEKEEVLVLRFSKLANSLQKWIFPGGRVDEKEKPMECLEREIKEETNLEVEVIKPIDVAMWGSGEDHRYAVFFLCTIKGNNNLKLSHEHQDYRWLSFGEEREVDFHDEAFERIVSKAREEAKKEGLFNS